MNLKTTFLLVLLTGGCVGLYFKGRELAPRVGLAVPETPAPSASADLLASLKPEAITRIDISGGKENLEFKSDAPGKPLQLAGNWPTRGPEVDELKSLLTHLQSRFAPIPFTENRQGEEYGIGTGEPTTVVKVEADGKTRTLTFSQAAVKPGENPFTRPTYLHVDGANELLRLGPDVMPVLARRADYYRKRQLFPDVERVRFEDAGADSPAAVPIVNDAVAEIEETGPAGPYTLSRITPTPKPMPPEGKPAADATLSPLKLADAWRLSAPLADRVDPAKLKALLTAVPDLWVEKFLDEKDPEKTGLDAKDKPMELRLKLAAGGDRTLIVGKTSRINTKTEPGTPMQPGMPAMPKIIEEKFYYGKLANNPQVFEINGSKLAAIFFNDLPDAPPSPEAFAPKVAVDELRDPNLMRFDSDRVTRIEVDRPDGPPLVLTKTKEGKEAAKKDRWDLVKPFKGLAETAPITDLLRPLGSLKATKAEILDRPPFLALLGGFGRLDLPLLGLDPASATVVRVTADGVPRALYIGKHDVARKKVFIRVEGQDRINFVSDELLVSLDKQPRAYRSLKLFDLGDNRIGSLEVARGTETTALRELPGATTKWELEQPVKAEADTAKASAAVGDLANLTASEYVFDPPGEAEKASLAAVFGATGIAAFDSAAGFGLKTPMLSISLHFAGPNPPPDRTLLVGAARADKPDQYYAQIAGSPSVFAIPKSAVETFTQGSVALLPTQLWSGATVTMATITKGSEEPYTVSKVDDSTWKIVAPFESAIDPGRLSALAGDLASVTAVKFEAHEAKDPAKYGLDKPAVKLTFTVKEKGPAPDAKEETKERTLLIGAVADAAADPAKKTHFAKLADRPAIFTVSEALFADADKSALDLVSKSLLTIGGSAISKIETANGTESLALVKAGADWKPEGAAFPLDKPTLDGLLRSVAALTAKSFAAYGPKVEWAKYGLDDASKPAKVTVTAGDKTHVILLGKETEDKAGRYARVDGGAGAALLPASVAKQLGQTKLDFVDRTVTKFDPTDLTGIRVEKNGKVAVDLRSDGRGWKIDAPTKEKADGPTLEELSDRLASLRMERVAAVDVKDFAAFGLDKPAASVILDRIDSKGKEARTTLNIGKKVDDKSPDRFIAAAGSNIVGVVSGSLAAKLLADPLAFRDLTLANFVNADKIEVKQPDGSKRTFAKSASGWKLTEPVKADAEDEPLRELHDGLAKLRAEEYVAEDVDDDDLAEYGLDKPTHWQLFNGDKEVLNLLVGKKDKTGQRRYAMLAGDDKVALLDIGTSAKIAREYRKRALWEPLDVAAANAIIISTKDGNSELVLRREAAGWVDAAKPAGKIKAEAVSDFLDCMASLKADRFVADTGGDAKLYGLQPPERVITVTSPAGRRTIELGRLDDSKRAYAKLSDGSEILLLGEKDTERLRRERADFGK